MNACSHMGIFRFFYCSKTVNCSEDHDLYYPGVKIIVKYCQDYDDVYNKFYAIKTFTTKSVFFKTFLFFSIQHLDLATSYVL